MTKLNEIQGLFYCHTVYGGEPDDAMGACDLDDERVQTLSVEVQTEDNTVTFHANVDRLGYVDPAMGQKSFDAAVAAARLCAASPDLLEALQELLKSGDCKNRLTVEKAEAAIAKAKGGQS